MNKKRMKGSGTAAVIIILLLAVVVGVYGYNSGWFATGAITTPGGNQPTPACIGGQTQSLDLNAYDVDAPATALTEANNIYRELGSIGSLGALTEGTALTTLSPGVNYEFLYGITGTAANNYDNAYGPHLVVRNLPCVMTKNIALFQDEVEASLTATFYNSNHDASGETTVASTPVTVYYKWYGSDKEYFGNPYVGEAGYLDIDWAAVKQSGVEYQKGATIGSHRPQFPNVICIQHNTTNFNQPNWVKAKLQDGSVVEMNKVSTPTIHSAAAGNKDYCYEAPVISGTAVEFQVNLDPKAVVATDDDTVSLYAGTFFMNTDTGTVSWGVEDNDGAAVGASDPDTLTSDMTA